MRGWWSARPKAKVWNDAVARAFDRRAGTAQPDAAEDTPNAVGDTPDAVEDAPERAVAPAAQEPSVASESPAAPESPVVPERPVAPEGPVAVFPEKDTPTRSPAPITPLFEPRPGEVRAGGLPTPTPTPTAAEARAGYEAPAIESSRTRIESPRRPLLSLAPDLLPETGASTPPTIDSQAEFLRLLEVVTSMCDHVIEYIEADRAERQQMVDTLAQLGRILTEGAANAVAAVAALPAAPAGTALRSAADGDTSMAPRPNEPWAFARPVSKSSDDVEWREQVIGGSVDAGPEPDELDLVAAESETRIGAESAAGMLAAPWGATEIAVEVRGRFGDRWVDGFEICEVMTTPSGPRYRLRRQRDGVVLPELFDATNIRHVETFEELNGEHLDPEQLKRAQENREQAGRERSMDAHPSGADGDPSRTDATDPRADGPRVNGPGSGYWSRS